jgi:signal transduction histidine kinase
MEMLLDDLLNYSRVGRTEVVPEDVDIAKLLQGIADVTDNPHGVSIRWPDNLPTFKTHRIPLEQVLMNLIGNAIKHNDKGSDGVVEILCERVGHAYHFRVKDNGPGIETQHHERVFQMYQRIGDNGVDGSGMGLAIVKKQVERVGGSIRVDCNHDLGVTFGFNWPSELAASEELSACRTATPPF